MLVFLGKHSLTLVYATDYCRQVDLNLTRRRVFALGALSKKTSTMERTRITVIQSIVDRSAKSFWCVLGSRLARMRWSDI